MREFVLMTDSCCDLTDEKAKELELEVLPLRLELDGASYKNWLDGREIGFKAFYDKVRGGAQATTAAVNVGEFEASMRAILESGRDVLCINFSSALSATYQSAVIAAEDVGADFPDGKIFVVDSLGASLGQGLLLHLCAAQKRAGKSIEEVREFAEETKGSICQWFTVDDLNHLKRGGRISATTALFGTMLSIKPVMHVDAEGRLTPVSKARGRKAALSALVDQLGNTAADTAGGPVFISHGDCAADAQGVADEITRRFGNHNIFINFIGPVIGNHAGPGTIAMFFEGAPR